jgi:Ca-activated chloride channel family protein
MLWTIGYLPWTAYSQSVPVSQRTRILFLFDASGSMHQPWSATNTETRMASAKKILNEIMDSIEKKNNVELALRVYGHQSPLNAKDCKDTRLEAGFSRNNIPFIRTKLKALNPRGITPIAFSLQQSATDFPDANARNIIILMTDGEESCGGDPCAVAYDLEKKKIILKHFAIGIGISETAAATFKCFGNFYNVKDQQSFRNVLTGIINKVTTSTTSQVNLLDKFKKPTETDVNMTFYDAYNGNFKYDYYQTLDGRGLPDTLTLDPVIDYDIIVHTLPAIKLEDVVINPGQHNIVETNAAQGILDFSIQGKLMQQQLGEKIKCVVRLKDEIINVQNLNSGTRYLAGTYDIEVLTLPRIKMNKVKIEANNTTKIEIATPGILNLQKRFEITGGIFLNDNNSPEKIFTLNSEAKPESIALQPGKYYIIYRLKNSKSMHMTKTVEFELKAGEGVNLVLQ